jgi:hypothetical protein
MFWRVLAIALLGPSRTAVAIDAVVEIRPGTKVEFASAATGARLLASRDVFVQAMSPFDRSARLKTDKDVTEAEYLAFVARQARDWSEGEKKRLRAILESFRARTARLDLRFPPSISLLKTTGLEEGMAAYCRGSSIVLPAKLVQGDPTELESTIFHELFHIYRRHYGENRRLLYKIIGFDVCPEIVLPAELRSRKITNPDAPLLDSFIRVRVGGRHVPAAPVLIARTERYDTKQDGEFFASMDFRLLVLEEIHGRLQPSMLQGKPHLLDPAEVPDYLDQVGRNTEYIIHPEEILADNFVLLVNGKSPVPSPGIIQQMRSLLTR